MNAIFRKSRFPFAVAMLTAGALGAGLGSSIAAESKVMLSGSQEVPSVSTNAAGDGAITVGSDRSVSGSVTTSGIMGTSAHIHEAAAGKNGPVIIPLAKTSDGVWSVPAGAKLTDAQYKSYEAGDLYVNVHSEAYKGGEIRAQMKP
jgi:CHRD domain